MNLFIFNSKKFLKVCVLFIFISIILCLDKAIVPLNLHRTTINQGIRSNSEIYFVGDSHSYWTFNPLIIENMVKTKTYNLSTSAQPFESTYFILKKILKEKETKLVFVETFSTTRAKKTKEISISARYVYDHFPIVDKFLIMSYYFDDFFDILKNTFNFHNYHNEWKKSDFFISKKIENRLTYRKDFHPAKGYSPHYNTNPSYNKKGYLNIPEEYFDKDILTNDQVKLSPDIEEMLLELFELAKKEKKKIILVSSPFYYQNVYAKENIKKVNYMENLAKKYNIETINFNKKYVELGIKRSHFKDSGHMNIFGAEIISQYIGNYINNNYKEELTDYSNDKKWIIQNEINSKLLDHFESLKNIKK